MNKFYYTYKITLLKGSLAGHYYYGQHRTSNLNDGYAGRHWKKDPETGKRIFYRND